MKIITARMFKDPVFILIHTLFALALVYSYFNEGLESFSSLPILAGMAYIVVLSMFLMFWNKNSDYYCNDCKTMTVIVTNIEIAEYEAMPKRKMNSREQEPKQRRKKMFETLMIFGSVASVVGLIFYFVN